MWKPKKGRIRVEEEDLTQQFGYQEGFKVPPCYEVHFFDLIGEKIMPPRWGWHQFGIRSGQGFYVRGK